MNRIIALIAVVALTTMWVDAKQIFDGLNADAHVYMSKKEFLKQAEASKTGDIKQAKRVLKDAKNIELVMYLISPTASFSNNKLTLQMTSSQDKIADHKKQIATVIENQGLDLLETDKNGTPIYGKVDGDKIKSFTAIMTAGSGVAAIHIDGSIKASDLESIVNTMQFNTSTNIGLVTLDEEQ